VRQPSGRSAEDEVRDLDATVAPTLAPADLVAGRLRPAVLFRWGFFAGVGLLTAYAAAQAILTVRNLLVLLLVAMFLAVSLDPAVRWLTSRGLRRGLAVALILLVLAAILAAFLVSVIPPLAAQFTTLVHNLPDYLAKLQAKSGRFAELNARWHLGQRLEGVVGQLPGRLTSGVVGLTGQLASALIAVLTVLVFTIYFLLDLPRLRKGVVRLFPVDRRARYGAMVDVVVDKVGTYMIGRLAIGLTGGVVAGIGLTLFHVPYALPLAIFIGLLDIVPLLGHPIGSLVAVLVALFTVALWPTTVLLIVFFVIYQQIENYLIGPRILGHSVDISSAAVLLAALIGAALLGVVGALMAIPIAAAIKVLLVQQIDQHEAAAASARRSPRWRRHHDEPAPTDPGPVAATRPAIKVP
jgi:predicted PurR-regulated permease PerM